MTHDELNKQNVVSLSETDIRMKAVEDLNRASAAVLLYNRKPSFQTKHDLYQSIAKCGIALQQLVILEDCKAQVDRFSGLVYDALEKKLNPPIKKRINAKN